jgi:hypothetical protein
MLPLLLLLLLLLLRTLLTKEKCSGAMLSST